MDLPSDLVYGYALGSWIEAWADGPDAGRLPDRRPAVGTVKITPDRDFLTSSADGKVLTGIYPKPTTCTIGDDGLLRDEAGGVGVFLITGVYQVVVDIKDAPLKKGTITVTTAHTEDAPLDIVAALPLTPGTTERFVVSEQTLIDARAAVARAEAAATRAEQAGDGVDGAVDSVNGRTGAVALTAADVNLGRVNNTNDLEKPVSTAAAAAIGARVPATRQVIAGTGTSGGGALSADVTLALSPATIASLAKADAAAAYTDTQVAKKADLSHTHTAAQISDATVVGRQVLTAADQASARNALAVPDWGNQIIAGTGLAGGGNLTVSRTLSLSPATIASLAKADGAAPAVHTHTASQITDAATAFVAPGRSISTDGTYLTGGGSLAADRSIALTAAAKASLGKADTASQPGHTHTAAELSNATSIGRSLLTATDAASARAIIGAGTGSGTGTSLATHPASASSGTSIILDVTQGTAQVFTLTGNATLAFGGAPSAAVGFQSTLTLKQDATGGRSVTWPSSILWAGTALPVLNTAAYGISRVRLAWDGVQWIGSLEGANYGMVGGTTTPPTGATYTTTTDTFAGTAGAAPKSMWSRSASYPTTGGTVTLNGSGGMVLAPATTAAWNDGGAASVFLGDPTHPEGVSGTGAPAIAPDYDYTFRYKLLNLLEQYQSIVLRGRNADLWTGGGGWNTFQVGTMMRLAPAGKAIEIITGYNTATIDTLSGFTFPSNDMYIRIMVKKSRLAFKIWAASLGKSGEPGGVGSDTNWTYTNATIIGNQSDGNIGFAAVNGPAVERKTVTISEFAATTEVLTLGTDRATFPADPAGFTRILTEDFNTDAVAGTGTGQFQKVYANSFQPYSDGGTVYNPTSPSTTGGANATSRMISAHDGVMDVYSDGVYASGGSFGSPTNTYDRIGGRFSIRMKAHGMFGNGPAFMIWPSDTAKGTWYFGELDFPESVSGRGGFMGFQDSPWIHHHKMVQGSEDQATSVPLNISWRDWHVYTLEWFPPGKGATPATGNVRYLVDGVEVANITNDVPSTVHRWCFQIGDWGTPGHIYIDGYAMSALAS